MSMCHAMLEEALRLVQQGYGSSAFAPLDQAGLKLSTMPPQESYAFLLGAIVDVHNKLHEHRYRNMPTDSFRVLGDCCRNARHAVACLPFYVGDVPDGNSVADHATDQWRIMVVQLDRLVQRIHDAALALDTPTQYPAVHWPPNSTWFVDEALARIDVLREALVFYRPTGVPVHSVEYPTGQAEPEGGWHIETTSVTVSDVSPRGHVVGYMNVSVYTSRWIGASSETKVARARHNLHAELRLRCGVTEKP